MVHLLEVAFDLPFREPVLIFTMVLLIILVAPIFSQRLRLPGIVGLILAGLLVGPNGFHILDRDVSIILLGTVGLLYIMFIAGLEIDLNDFIKNKNTSITLGLLTFLIPQVAGFLAGYYVLHLALAPSILLGALLGSHTLLAYPIASKLGISKSRSATITVGSTIFADLLSLLVLAVIASSARGQLDTAFWVRLIISIILYAAVVLWGLPRLARWFFRNVPGEGAAQYIFVLVVVFATGFLAEVAGLEAIIGAFLAGLLLNRLIPHTSPLMNRIEFVGNTIFIPFFLISVGMLVDLRVLLLGIDAWIVALTMIFVAITGKWLAALFTQKIFGFSAAERNVIFGLSNARAAATLTAVLIGFDLGILDENVLNGAILMILVTCVISSLVVEKSGRVLAIQENQQTATPDGIHNRILVPISNPATIEQLIDFAILIKDPRSHDPIYPLAVVKEADDSEEQLVRTYKMLQKAIYHASATEHSVQLVSRIDMNIAGGILRAMRELLITEVVIGWNGKITTRERIFGSVLDNLLTQSQRLILVCKIIHPLNTTRHIKVVVPPNAEHEKGFLRWVGNLQTIARQIGANLHIFGNPHTTQRLQSILSQAKPAVKATYFPFEDWDNFYSLREEVTENDLLLVVSARQGALSYTNHLDRIPRQLAQGFQKISFVIIYPDQDSVYNGSDQATALSSTDAFREAESETGRKP